MWNCWTISVTWEVFSGFLGFLGDFRLRKFASASNGLPCLDDSWLRDFRGLTGLRLEVSWMRPDGSRGWGARLANIACIFETKEGYLFCRSLNYYLLKGFWSFLIKLL